MKLATIVLATAFALPSSFALAQAGLSGYGSTVAPSAGSYVAPSVGSTVNETPTWSTTVPAAAIPGPGTRGDAFGNPVPAMRSPRQSTVAPPRPIPC